MLTFFFYTLPIIIIFVYFIFILIINYKTLDTKEIINFWTLLFIGLIFVPIVNLYILKLIYTDISKGNTFKPL